MQRKAKQRKAKQSKAKQSNVGCRSACQCLIFKPQQLTEFRWRELFAASAPSRLASLFLCSFLLSSLIFVCRIGAEQSNATENKATKSKATKREAKQSKATSCVGLSVSVLSSNCNNQRDLVGVNVSPHAPLLASPRSPSLLLSSPLLSLRV